MRIGLLGFGTVGKGVYEIISSREDMTVTKVLCRRDLELSDAVVTHDFANILEDETIDTVVEAIGIRLTSMSAPPFWQERMWLPPTRPSLRLTMTT